MKETYTGGGFYSTIARGDTIKFSFIPGNIFCLLPLVTIARATVDKSDVGVNHTFTSILLPPVVTGTIDLLMARYT